MMNTKEEKEYVEKMDTEEVIKVFKKLIRYRNLFKLMDSEVDFYSKVIEFLERGKKYEEMWEELEEIDGATEWEMVSLNDIKQEYFPVKGGD